jgi:hypothetical protein
MNRSSDGWIPVAHDRVARSKYLINRSKAVLAVTETYVVLTGDLLRHSMDRLAFTPPDSWGHAVASLAIPVTQQ